MFRQASSHDLLQFMLAKRLVASSFEIQYRGWTRNEGSFFWSSVGRTDSPSSNEDHRWSKCQNILASYNGTIDSSLLLKKSAASFVMSNSRVNRSPQGLLAEAVCLLISTGTLR